MRSILYPIYTRDFVDSDWLIHFPIPVEWYNMTEYKYWEDQVPYNYAKINSYPQVVHHIIYCVLNVFSKIQ